LCKNRAGPLRTLPTHLALAPNVPHAIWIPPVSDSLISENLRQWAQSVGVSPVKIPGYWVTSAPSFDAANEPAGENEKIVYCLHGGAYTQLSAFPGDLTANIAKGLLKTLKRKGIVRIFSVEYRLSKGAPHKPIYPFPTALLDALSGYYYLVHERGYKPENIIIEGDSAGGNLAMALTRYLCTNAGSIPRLPSPPAGIVLLSPWSDLSGSHDGPGSSTLTLYASDYLSYPSSEPPVHPETGPVFVGYHIRSFLGPHGVDAAQHNEYISPASKHLSSTDSLFRFSNGVNWPTTFLTGGGAEMIRDQIRTLKERMEENSVDLEYVEKPDATHDWVVLEWFEPERGETLREVSAWTDKVWK
jgi:acetyl esterase/lipase